MGYEDNFRSLKVKNELYVGKTITGAGSINSPGTVYYVDEENGNDNYSGLSWGNAKATILAATALCRDDYSDDAEYHIFIAPGSYDETADLRLYGHGIHLHGLGYPGCDSGVNITDTNCTYAPILLAGANCTIENIHFIMTSATNSSYGGIFAIAADNCLIRNCGFKNASGTGTYGMMLANVRTTKIYNNMFGEAGSDFGTSIHAAGGADYYLIDSHIAGNRIWANGASAKGIYITSAATLVTYGTVIERNFINLSTASGASIGIDNDNTGVVMICDNYVCMASGDTPIEAASSPTGIIGNHSLAGSSTVDPNEAAD